MLLLHIHIWTIFLLNKTGKYWFHVTKTHLSVTLTDAFDVNVPSELPQEAALHQDTAGGFWDLQRGRSPCSVITLATTHA